MLSGLARGKNVRGGSRKRRLTVFGSLPHLFEMPKSDLARAAEPEMPGYHPSTMAALLAARRSVETIPPFRNTCPHDFCWNSWKNATQMPAISWQLTAVQEHDDCRLAEREQLQRQLLLHARQRRVRPVAPFAFNVRVNPKHLKSAALL